MEILSSETNPTLSSLREQVKKEIREDYEFALFCVIPGLTDQLSEIQHIGKKIGIDSSSIKRFSRLLIDSELWKVRGETGTVHSNFELLDLGDISIPEYLSMTVCIISRLSEKKSYEYDSLSLVTSRSLIRTFVREVNQSLKNLYSQSNSDSCEKECLFSWTHTGVIEYELKNKKSRNKESE